MSVTTPNNGRVRCQNRAHKFFTLINFNFLIFAVCIRVGCNSYTMHVQRVYSYHAISSSLKVKFLKIVRSRIKTLLFNVTGLGLRTVQRKSRVPDTMFWPHVTTIHSIPEEALRARQNPDLYFQTTEPPRGLAVTPWRHDAEKT